jgi:hypothetical protein
MGSAPKTWRSAVPGNNKARWLAHSRSGSTEADPPFRVLCGRVGTTDLESSIIHQPMPEKHVESTFSESGVSLFLGTRCRTEHSRSAAHQKNARRSANTSFALLR